MLHQIEYYRTLSASVSDAPQLDLSFSVRKLGRFHKPTRAGPDQACYEQKRRQSLCVLCGRCVSLVMVRNQSPVAATRDRKERAQPLLPRSARLVEEHTDHGVRGRQRQSALLNVSQFSVGARWL